MSISKTIATILAAGALSACAPRTGTSILDFHPRREVKALLRQASQDPNSVTLLHFTDLHGYTPNLERVAEFYDAYDDLIDDAIHAGDAVSCYWSDPNGWDEVPAARRILNAVGNHDCWKGFKVWAETDVPYDAAEEDVWQTIMVGKDPERPFWKEWGVTRPEGAYDPSDPRRFACYYYKDYTDAGVRLIVLDALHYDAGNAQDGWFAGILADALASGLQVVTVQHYTPQNGLEYLECGFSPVDDWDMAVENPDVPQIEAMRDAFFCRVDEFIAAGGIYVCSLCGHTHTDAVGYPKGHLPQLQIVAEKAGEFDIYMKEPREIGTPTQDAFNLITINPESGTLVLNRIGSCEDELGRSKRLLVYDYFSGRLVKSE